MRSWRCSSCNLGPLGTVVLQHDQLVTQVGVHLGHMVLMCHVASTGLSGSCWVTTQQQRQFGGQRICYSYSSHLCPEAQRMGRLKHVIVAMDVSAATTMCASTVQWFV